MDIPLNQRGASDFRPSKVEFGNPDPQAWMLTFSDLLILLLTMFVLRLSMSSIQNQQIVEAVRLPEKNSIEGFIDAFRPIGSSNKANPLGNEFQVTKPQLNLNAVALYSRIAAELENELGQPEANLLGGEFRQYASGVSIRRLDDGLELSLGAGSFSENSDALSFRAAVAIGAIAHVAVVDAYQLEITAHASRVSGLESAFPSSWELSAGRALAVLRQMIDAGVEAKRVSLATYGNSFAKTDNSSTLVLHQKNRVDIVLRGNPLAEEQF